MTPEEHIAEARDSALTAGRLFDENRELQASEIVWCSVKHAVNAIAVRRRWQHSSYIHKKQVIRRLSDEIGNPDMMRLLNVARLLHVHSDNGVLLDAPAITKSRVEIAVFTEQLLAIAEANAQP